MAIREQNVPSGAATVQSPPISPFRRAAEDYKDALFMIWKYEDATQRVRDVWTEAQGSEPPKDYATTVQRNLKLTEVMQAAWMPKEVLQGFEGAFSQYLKQLQEAWTKLDMKTVTPADLGLIAQSMLEGANLLAIPMQRTESK